MGRWLITRCFFKKKKLIALLFKIKNLSLQAQIKNEVKEFSRPNF